ncbi:MAG: aldo/keto reductase [Lachnospiraceae bacterium]|nr:aldo/keto reductase [Lachnospiraceae bacterium]
MGRKVKWGVLGTAGIAAGCTIPGMQKVEDCELYAIAGRSLEKAEDFRKRFGFEKAYEGYEALLSDKEVEAVYIPLPNDIHCKWVIKALEAGKHVLCEKPIAMNEGELIKMYEAARKNGVILMEAYAYLHSPYIKALKDIVKNGEIGEVDYVDTAFLTQDYSKDFRLHKELGGGGIYDVGCYCTTMILSLIDSPISYVKADAEFDGEKVDHMASVLIGFENGARASFNVGMMLGKDTCDRYDRLFIHGSKGYIRSDVEYNQEGELKFLVTVKDEAGERITSQRSVTALSNYSLEIGQMNDCIINGSKPHISEEFSVKNMHLLDKILDTCGYTEERREFVLDNGVVIPAVGYGSFLATNSAGPDIIRQALDAGYRYFDTASFYRNEADIGKALKEYGIDRSGVFLCSKVWPLDLGREKTLASFEESLKNLGTDYLDMFLIHWPKVSQSDENWAEKVKESWQVMEELYEKGKVRAIGLSNFLPHHIMPLLESARIRPMVDQLELHVGYMQEYALSYLRREGILPQAWSPLGHSRVINDERVLEIAGKYGKSPAQVLLRYLNQRNIPVIPKTSNRERMTENLEIFDFKLNDEELSFLSCIPQTGWGEEHPDLVEWS